ADTVEPDQVPTVSDVVSRFGAGEAAPPALVADAPQPHAAMAGAPTVAMLTAMVQALSASMPAGRPEPEAAAEIPQTAPEAEAEIAQPEIAQAEIAEAAPEAIEALLPPAETAPESETTAQEVAQEIQEIPALV